MFKQCIFIFVSSVTCALLPMERNPEEKHNANRDMEEVMNAGVTRDQDPRIKALIPW